MADAPECRLDDDEEDDASVHSAISNASDFEEDEEVDYLALELVQYLPADKVTKLCKNMRTKEKAIQDLLHRNRMLLESCQKLDEENQALSEQLKEGAAAEKPKSAAQPPSAQPAAAPVVDSSVFLKLERGKEEQILTLRSENERLKAQVRRLNDCGQQLEDALAQARKELKKVQQGGHRPEPRGSPKAGAGLDRQVLEEEERIYRELQGETAADLITKKMQDRQAENRAKVQTVLQALLSDDLQRIKHWSSDVAAMMLAVEGTEALLKHGPKEPKDVKDPKDPKAQKRGKETSGGGGDLRAGGEPGVPDAVFADFREVRAMGKRLISNLEEGGKALNERTEQVIAAMYGESSVASGEKARSGANPSTASGTAEEPRVAATEAKRRKARRKGRAEPEPPAAGPGGGAGGAAAPAAEGEGGGKSPRPRASPSAARLDGPPARACEKLDEDSQLRADFREVFRDFKDEGPGSRAEAGDSAEAPGAVLAGPGLLHELQALRSDAEALEARLAERLRARAEAADDGEAQGGSAAKPKARRKKMYA